jgi:uncharacterized protein GlcG (DUF336 family)
MAVTLTQANRAIAAALARAAEIGARISVSVCDDASHLAHQRMDGAMSETSRASIGKAMVAATFGVPSGADHPKPTTNFPSAAKVFSGEVPAWPSPGGLPIRFEGALQGAIGVAGAPTHAADDDCSGRSEGNWTRKMKAGADVR